MCRIPTEKAKFLRVFTCFYAFPCNFWLQNSLFLKTYRVNFAGKNEFRYVKCVLFKSTHIYFYSTYFMF